MNILSGEPLAINLPSGSSAVIGLYCADGKGILFNDNFYWTLYRIITKCIGESDILARFMPFIFVECS
jgi:hypothetical protein